MQTALAGQPEVSVEAQPVKKSLSPFEPFLVKVVIKNNSSHPVVMQDTALLAMRSYPSRPHLGLHYWAGFKWSKSGWLESFGLVALPQDYRPRFFLLQPGQYVKRLLNYSYSFGSGGDEENSGTEMFIRLHHRIEIAQEKKMAEDFAALHGALVLNSDVDSQHFKVHYIPPKNDIEEKMLTFVKRRAGGDEEYLTHFATWIETAPYLKYSAVHQYSAVHPIWDYQYALSWQSFTFSEVGQGLTVRQILEKHLAKIDTILTKYQGDPIFDALQEYLLWRKVAILFALGRDAEAEAIKQSIIAKEPNRCFFFELQWLKNTIKDLKENLQTNKEQQNNTTQPTSPEPEHPTPKKESSTMENHGVAAEQASPLPEHETETVEKRRVRSERGVGVAERRPPVAQRSDNFWLWLTLFGLAAVFVFILLSRRR